MPQHLNTSPDLAGRAFDALAKKALPSITAAGLQQVIDVYWEAEGLQTIKGTPEKYMDLSCQQRAES